MLIDRSIESDRDHFRDLVPGDVFEYVNRIFMKLATTPKNNIGFNCADLESGALAWCEDDALVAPRPEAELTGV